MPEKTTMDRARRDRHRAYDPIEWCLVYDHLGNTRFSYVAASLIEGLPAIVTDDPVMVCGRAFFETMISEHRPLPRGRVFMVRRVAEAQFEFYEFEEPEPEEEP